MELQTLVQDQVEELRSEKYSSFRASSPELEELLYKPIKILDHGFIRVVDYMGNDNSIVQAARVSYGKGTKQVNQDAGLINYLMRHWHTTPFEMCEIKLHVKLPIFVARQWIRHRSANVNEYSARYSILDKEFYIPELEYLTPQSKINNQGRSTEQLSPVEAARVLEILKGDSEQCYDHYQEMLNQDENGGVLDENKQGVARELARMNLTLNYYTQWYWKIDLHNLLHFLRLRADSHAQYEIKVYADVILEILKRWVPITYEAFMNHRVKGANFSAKGLDLIKRLISGEKVTQVESGLSKREWNEIAQILNLEIV